MAALFEKALLGAKWLTYHVLCRGDYRNYVGLRAAAVRYVARRGWYERRHVQFLRSRVRSGDTVVDVGANLGAYSITLADAVGESGKVLAFEPMAEVFEWLLRNTAHLPQVSCYGIALSDRSAAAMDMTVPLLFGSIPEPSLAGLSVGASRCDKRQVRVAMLDDYLDRLSGLSFIKVDVEGHELAFLQGARRTLAEFRPLVQFESNDIQRQYGSFQEFAEPLGFSVCGLTDTDGLRRLDGLSTPSGYNFYLAPTEGA